jgi:hypothetical protein
VPPQPALPTPACLRPTRSPGRYARLRPHPRNSIHRFQALLATKSEKSAAGSALAQTKSSDQTGPRAASAAGKSLGSAGATKAEKSAAASALSQTPRLKK